MERPKGAFFTTKARRSALHLLSKRGDQLKAQLARRRENASAWLFEIRIGNLCKTLSHLQRRPAKAGTHTPCRRCSGTALVAFEPPYRNHDRQGLWVPACALVHAHIVAGPMTQITERLRGDDGALNYTDTCGRPGRDRRRRSACSGPRSDRRNRRRCRGRGPVRNCGCS